MRILLILFPFFLTIGGLVFLQAGLFVPQTGAQGGAAASAASARAPAAPGAMPLSDVTEVVARLPADQPTGQVRPVARPARAQAGGDDMQSLTMNVLASLGMAPAPGAPVSASAAAGGQGGQDEMEALTMAVLAGLSGSRPAPAASDPPAENLSLADLVSRAVARGQSDAYLDALINEAADSGRIEVPGALRTANGRVDTDALLRALIQAGNGSGPARNPEDIIPTGAGVEVRVVQEAGQTVPYYFYTVQEGDSLGAIALNFYGDAALYKVIYEANRRLLSSPDRIRIGQRLRIPARRQG